MTVDEIKTDIFVRDLKQRPVMMLLRSDYGWRVEMWTSDGVAPQTEYDTPHEALARVAQLLGITDPIIPQAWPEYVQIGHITTNE